MSSTTKATIRDRIRPTVIIGLGGTGKKALMKIRRRFYDRFGQLDQFPSVAYLYLDTDTNEVGQNTEAGGHRVIADAIEFANDETVSITVEQTAPYVDSPKTHPHVSAWFYPNLRDKADLVQGAGAIRPYGRLAFFHRYDRVSSSIQNAVQKVTSMRSIQVTMDNGLRVVTDGSVDVFIVGSLAGGTGSGTLLDTTFLVKHIAPQAKRYGFVALPSVFSTRSEGEARFANGYAALKEVNHYTLRPDANRVSTVDELQSLHDFHVQWSLGESERSIAGPPFHYLYLLDAVNDKGIHSDMDGVSELMADAIFYEFAMSEFGAHKRSLRDNTDQFLCQVAEIKDEDGSTMNRPQPKHYSAFGLGRITFPADHVRVACAAMLGQRVVGQWEKASDTTITPQQVDDFLVRQGFLEKLGLLDTRQRGKMVRANPKDSQLVAGLARTSGRANNLFEELNGWVNELRGEVGRLAGTRTSLAAILRERFKDREQKVAGWDSNAESEWRDLARTLRSNLVMKQDDVKKALDHEIDLLLSDRAYSLGYARAVLNRIYHLLGEEKSGYMDFYKDERARAEKDAAEMSRRLNNALSELELDGDQMVALPVWRPMTRRYLAGRVLDVAKAYFEAKLRAAVAEFCYQFAAWVHQQLKEENQSGLRARLTALDKTVSAIKHHLAEHEKRGRQVPQNARQIVLFDESELPGIYRDLLDGQEEEQVKKMSGEALSVLGGNLFALSGAVQRMGTEGVARTVLTLCMTPFAEKLRLSPKYSAMARFKARFHDAQVQEDKLSNLFAASEAFVRFRQDGLGGQKVDMQQKAIIVGRYLPDDAAEEYRQFDDLLGRSAGVKLGFHKTDNRNEIVIYNEVGGYPLFLLQALGDMREAYMAARDKDAKLHIDHHQAKFGDLVPLVGKAYNQYREVVRDFCLAQALGILRVESHNQSGLPVFVFLREMGFGKLPRPEYLGYEDTAIERLLRFPDLRRSLHEQVERRRADIYNQGAEAVALLYAVLVHYEESVYRANQMHAEGGAYEYDNPIMTSVLATETESMIQQWQPVPEWGQMATVYADSLRMGRPMPQVKQLAPHLAGMENRVAVNF
jgi:hypothetical protein